MPTPPHPHRHSLPDPKTGGGTSATSLAGQRPPTAEPSIGVLPAPVGEGLRRTKSEPALAASSKSPKMHGGTPDASSVSFGHRLNLSDISHGSSEDGVATPVSHQAPSSINPARSREDALGSGTPRMGAEQHGPSSLSSREERESAEDKSRMTGRSSVLPNRESIELTNSRDQPPSVPQVAATLNPPPDTPARVLPAEYLSMTTNVATYGTSAAIREGIQSNDGLHSLPTPLSVSTSGAQAALASSLSGTVGSDLFAGIDTFLTVQSALSDRKNRIAASDFTKNQDNVGAYNIRKGILESYKTDSPVPQKLSAKDVKFVRDFEELQGVAKGNKKLKDMTRFRDLAVQPTAALYNTSVSIAHMATVAPSALSYGTSGLGLVSGPINMVAGSLEANDARNNHGRANRVLRRAAQLDPGGKMATLIGDQFTQLATDKKKQSKEAGFNGVSRLLNGTTGTVTASLAIASVATGVATLGIGAAIAGGVVGGYFAATYARKVYKAKRLEKRDLRAKDVVDAFIAQKNTSGEGIYSKNAFEAVAGEFSGTVDGDGAGFGVPSRQWHGKIKPNGELSVKPITGADINNNRYIKEYVAAGHIATFLDSNPLDGAEMSIGEKYISDLKTVVGRDEEEKVDALIYKAKACGTFGDKMEILKDGLHDIFNI
jgi:hypothetical protein